MTFILKVDEATANTPITLKLSNVPLIEAIRYTAALARCHYEMVGDTVTITALRRSAAKRDEPRQLKLSPSDLWFHAYTSLKKGQEKEEKGENLAAQQLFQQASNLFTPLKKGHPDFHPELVDYRLKQLQEKLKGFHAPPRK